jgi:hypothetical protein
MRHPYLRAALWFLVSGPILFVIVYQMVISPSWGMSSALVYLFAGLVIVAFHLAGLLFARLTNKYEAIDGEGR